MTDVLSKKNCLDIWFCFKNMNRLTIPLCPFCFYWKGWTKLHLPFINWFDVTVLETIALTRSSSAPWAVPLWGSSSPPPPCDVIGLINLICLWSLEHYPITTSVDLKMLMSVRVLLSDHTPATDSLHWTHRPGLVILLQEPLRDADGVDLQHLYLFFSPSSGWYTFSESLLIKTDPLMAHTKAKLIILEMRYMSILLW